MSDETRVEPANGSEPGRGRLDVMLHAPGAESLTGFVGQSSEMKTQRLLAVVWQSVRAVFMLGVGWYMGRHFMSGGGIGGWISRAACSLMFVGGFANVLVVLLNRGMMPVRIDEVLGRWRFCYEPIHSKTHLWYLGDCIRIRSRYFSPGDICLYSGFLVMISGVVLPQLIR